MGHWSFATNTTGMQALISDYRTAVNDYSCGASPLHPDDAFIKIWEICQQIVAEGPNEFGIKKRHSSAEVSELKGAEAPKQTRASIIEPMMLPTIDKAMSEVRQILLTIL